LLSPAIMGSAATSAAIFSFLDVMNNLKMAPALGRP
jgi:hypothetical protein